MNSLNPSIKQLEYLFISDLHLSIDTPQLTSAFLKFLRKRACHAQALYILGDFFEVWLGDDIQTPLHQTIAQAIRDCANSGTLIYFAHGNRDFLLGNDYANDAGFKLLNEFTVLSFNDIHYLLCHGDQLCTLDRNYQRLRSIVRSRIVQAIFKTLPTSWRQQLGHYLRRKSAQIQKNHLNTKNISHPPIQFDVVDTTVINILKQYDCQVMIHGHTHRPAQHQLSEHSMLYTRYVLSDWDKTADYLCLDELGLHRYPINI